MFFRTFWQSTKTFQMTRFKEILPKVLPTGAALLLFFIVSAPISPPQFRGEVLPQHDVQQYEGMAKEIWDNRAQTGERSPVGGADVRRHARLPDQCSLPGTASQKHGRTDR